MDKKVKAFLDAAIICKQGENESEISISKLEVDPYLYRVIQYPLFKDTMLRVVTRRRRVVM